jgi:hypothetical protein
LREGHEFTRAAKSLKLCPRFSARGELLALSASFSSASSGVPQTAKRLTRFSGCCAGEIRRLKPFHAWLAWAASLKRSPDTNRLSYTSTAP